MIVIINSIDLPIVTETVAVLAERYESGAGLSLHALPTADRSQTQEVCRNVAAEKQQGKHHAVISGGFFIPEALKHLRGSLSDYDDEIYAFRLRFNAALMKALSASSATDTEAAYAIWLDNQEAGAHDGDMGYEIVVKAADAAEIAGAIWNDIHAPVELVEYQNCWPAMFAQEQTRIRTALQGLIRDVEHIGSTAIPEMSAKPIIDILVTIARLDEAQRCIQPLRELGYAFIDYPQNTDRRFFRKGEPRRYHLHIVEHESRSARNYLVFREALLADADLRKEYLQLKRDALRRYKHRRALYGEQKGALIQKALAQYRRL